MTNRDTIRSIIATHTKVGGYPDTMAIAHEAYRLGCRDSRHPGWTEKGHAWLDAGADMSHELLQDAQQVFRQHLTKRNHEEDACIIAELLNALENLLAVHEGEGGAKYHAGDIARAAIAKSRGETA